MHIPSPDWLDDSPEPDMSRKGRFLTKVLSSLFFAASKETGSIAIGFGGTPFRRMPGEKKLNMICPKSRDSGMMMKRKLMMTTFDENDDGNDELTMEITNRRWQRDYNGNEITMAIR